MAPFITLNSKINSPNPHIDFIRVLPQYPDHQQAQKLLEAIAAQFKKLMKAEGLAVRSLEEYEWNEVFGGRNWNNGEVIEIVLRGRNNQFLSIPWLITVMAHELAHIRHMNHAAGFQKENAKFRGMIRQQRAQGNYGDGMYSQGIRLGDNQTFAGDGLDGTTTAPEYTCGGAKKKSTQPRKRKPRASSFKTRKKPRKAGGKVARNAFPEQGNSLVDEVTKENSSFRKRTQAKDAREMRALAAERRLAGSLVAEKGKEKAPDQDGSSTEEETDHEADADERHKNVETQAKAAKATILLDDEEEKYLAQERNAWYDDDCIPAYKSSKYNADEDEEGRHVIEISD